MKSIVRSWRDASSLILLAKESSKALSRCHNYNILVQTRPPWAFANALVFPAGVAESADADADWLRLLKSFGYNEDHFNSLHRPNSPANPLFQNNPVQRHISLRISAIRETFEETGILVCSRKHKDERSRPFADFVTGFDVKHWQNKVSSNPQELLNLCSDLGCYPDIWSLYFWSSWLTPTILPKRFSTAFFLTAFEGEPPEIYRNEKEAVDIQWLSCEEILSRRARGEVHLEVPQVYELARLSQLEHLDAAVKFAAERGAGGDELLYPVVARAKDGLVFILPGDDLYPPVEEHNYSSEILDWRDKSVEQLLSASEVVHRVQRGASGDVFVVRKYRPRDHLAMSPDRITPS